MKILKSKEAVIAKYKLSRFEIKILKNAFEAIDKAKKSAKRLKDLKICEQNAECEIQACYSDLKFQPKRVNLANKAIKLLCAQIWSDRALQIRAMAIK